MTTIALRLIAFACMAAALPCAQSAPPAAVSAAASAAAAGPSAPVVQVSGAWARATVAGQSSSAAYMVLTAPAAQTLVAAETDAAGLTELHEMAMQGDVMRMRQLANGLALPAGQAVTLKPGGLHIMLMQLKRPLQAGEVLPLTLTFKAADGTLRTQQVPVTVQRSAPAAAGHGTHGMPPGHGRGH